MQKKWKGSIYEKKKSKPHHTQCYTWELYGTDALLFLRTIEPYTIIKKKKINSILLSEKAKELPIPTLGG